MIYYFLYTFTDGEKTLYIFVATKRSVLARSMAWDKLQYHPTIESPSIIGLNFVKTLNNQSDFDMLANNNDHYNIDVQQIDNILNHKTSGTVVGDWVKE